MKLKLPLSWGTAFAVLAVAALLGTADTARAQTFNPTYDITFADTQAGANSEWTSSFSLPEGDLQFGGLVFFIPPEFGITPGDEIPIGAVVGELSATATLGLINGACSNSLPVNFIMLNASIDPTDTVIYLDTDPIPTRLAEDVSAQDSELVVEDATGLDSGDFIDLGAEKLRIISASGNRLEVERGVEETEAAEHSLGSAVFAEGLDKEDYFEDIDRSGLQDGIEKYPDFITRVLDDTPGDEVGNPLQPIRRSAGITTIAGVHVLLQFLIFEPGTFIDEQIPNDESLGYPSVTLLQNAGDPAEDPIPSAITDFCSPLTTTIVSFGVSKDNGCTDTTEERPDPICEVQSALFETPEEGVTDPDESGVPLFTSPEEGTYTFNIIAAGQRDADGDGYENSLDVCPFDANLGDPRIQGDADEDNDGLDAACDPNDDETNSDEDLDGFLNRQDNCPLVANGENEDNQRDTDNDSIGDACDPNPDDEDAQGELIIVQVPVEVTIGPGGPPAEDETPADGDTTPPSEDGDDDGGSAIIFIIIGIVAAVVVVGGGAFYFMRRGGGGGGGATA